VLWLRPLFRKSTLFMVDYYNNRLIINNHTNLLRYVINYYRKKFWYRHQPPEFKSMLNLSRSVILLSTCTVIFLRSVQFPWMKDNRYLLISVPVGSVRSPAWSATCSFPAMKSVWELNRWFWPLFPQNWLRSLSLSSFLPVPPFISLSAVSVCFSSLSSFL